MQEDIEAPDLPTEVLAIMDWCLSALRFPSSGVPELIDESFPGALQDRLIEDQNPQAVRGVQLFAQFLLEKHGDCPAAGAILLAATVHVEGPAGPEELEQKVEGYLAQFSTGQDLKNAPKVGSKRPEGAIPVHTLMQPFRPPRR